MPYVLTLALLIGLGKPGPSRRRAGRTVPEPVSHDEPFPLVNANPYPWPFDGDATPANTALVVIDMQTDFCGIGGYVDRMGYDLARCARRSSRSARCWRRARAFGCT